jgi:hypothetical protein
MTRNNLREETVLYRSLKYIYFKLTKRKSLLKMHIFRRLIHHTPQVGKAVMLGLLTEVFFF